MVELPERLGDWASTGKAKKLLAAITQQSLCCFDSSQVRFLIHNMKHLQEISHHFSLRVKRIDL